MLIIDNFAGGGGASTGIEAALGVKVDVAINHDPEAIAMHTANHPETDHLCENVFAVHPQEVTQGQGVALAWFSPDCTHHSKAKGSKPVKKHIRGLAWIVNRWVRTVRPRVIILENVEEFKDWGALDPSGRPDPKHRGKTFNFWVGHLLRHGYKVEWRELRACDYGAPTIRKRLFLIARCDGQPIKWPDPTHAPRDSFEVQAGLKDPYVSAGDILDFSIPCPSIFERAKPLADATQARIAKGIEKYVLNTQDPFVIPKERLGAHQGNDHSDKILAYMAQHNTGVVGRRLADPLSTVTATGTQQNLVTSHLVKLRNNCFGTDARDPMHTVTTSGNHFGEVRAFLVKYYGTGGQWASANDPVHTITARDRMGLVTVQIDGETYAVRDIGMRMLSVPELYRAQGFPKDYRLDVIHNGQQLTQKALKRLCGNSVCPPLAKALVRANVGQEYVQRQVA